MGVAQANEQITRPGLGNAKIHVILSKAKNLATEPASKRFFASLRMTNVCWIVIHNPSRCHCIVREKCLLKVLESGMIILRIVTNHCRGDACVACVARNAD